MERVERVEGRTTTPPPFHPSTLQPIHPPRTTHHLPPTTRHPPPLHAPSTPHPNQVDKKTLVIAAAEAAAAQKRTVEAQGEMQAGKRQLEESKRKVERAIQVRRVTYVTHVTAGGVVPL